MSARDSSALAFVAALRHGRKRMVQCRCEQCEAIKRVLKLATAYVSTRQPKGAGHGV